MKPIAVYVVPTQSIGVILEQGEDSQGKWYRTDCSGIREIEELIFLNTKKELKRCTKQLNAYIAPSTKKLLAL
jgi:hypothetical protein